VRRPRRAAADEDHRSDRTRARGRLHRERDQVPAARQPQPRARRSGAVRTLPVPADRQREAESDRGARQVRRAVFAADQRPDHAHPRARVQVSRCDSDSDVSPRVSAAHALGEARGVGGYEARPRDSERRRLKTILVPLISVAVPVPFLDPLTYHVPESMPVPPIGARVRVPVGSRTMTGCVVQHDALVEEGTDVKDVAEALDREPLLPASIVELCRWVADYYVAGVGDALAVAMPPGARGKASAYFKKKRIAAISAMGSDPCNGSTQGVESPRHPSL